MAKPKEPFNRTQSITLTISITGDQHVQVDTHGGRAPEDLLRQRVSLVRWWRPRPGPLAITQTVRLTCR